MKENSIYILATAAILAGWALTPTRSHAAKNHNLNISFDGNAEHCSDIKVRSNGEIAQSNETFTLQRSEAPILEMTGMERSVLRVRGWDRQEYSIEACKVAVADNRAGAEQALRGITVTRTGGRFSESGPSSDDAEWQLYFIVHAPKDGSLNLETKNGPIDVGGINGTLKVRAYNGPVAVHDCAGLVEVHTANGPISFNGGGGEVHLNAQNGPISLNLAGDIWNGSQLDARTVNGPVSIMVADTFRSGLRLETSGRAPVSCGAGICRNAWSNTGSNQHVMQLNGSNDTIRVSTSNGPVSINGPSKGKRII